MKKNFLPEIKLAKNLLFIFFIISFSTHSQSVQKQVKDIRAKYDLISAFIKTPACSIKEIKFSCSDYPAYGQILFYSEGSQVRMIEMSNDDGSHGGATERYYIWKGKLIFYFNDSGSWGFDGGKDSVIGKDTIYFPFTKDRMTEDRYYFSNKKVIKCLHKEYEFRSTDVIKTDPSTVPNTEGESCEGEGILKTFAELVKLFPLKIKDAECPAEIATIFGN
ncbi:MAG: hypothetical protein IAF38_04210 [Bacteroidia bacterium]|nr:hypothetical protein [Bacteroidia bacterium]